MRRAGSARPEATSAARTRSRASDTALSGRPTTLILRTFDPSNTLPLLLFPLTCFIRMSTLMVVGTFGPLGPTDPIFKILGRRLFQTEYYDTMISYHERLLN